MSLGRAWRSEALLELFRTSAIYICTSVYEPFGWRRLKLRVCGCAVVARDMPSFREVWGDAALYFRRREELQDESAPASLETRERLAPCNAPAASVRSHFAAEAHDGRVSRALRGSWRSGDRTPVT